MPSYLFRSHEKHTAFRHLKLMWSVSVNVIDLIYNCATDHSHPLSFSNIYQPSRSCKHYSASILQNIIKIIITAYHALHAASVE